MSNDTEKQEKVDKIKRLIDEARKARDMDTVKALGETIFELTGVQEPEFAAVEPSGNPELDKLRKHLVDAIAARDEDTEAALRAMIVDIEGEKLPEVTVELTAEEPVEVVEEEAIENPFDIPEDCEAKEPATFDVPFTDGSLPIDQMMGGVVMATQIAALRKAGIETASDMYGYVQDELDKEAVLTKISGIGKSSAKTILERLGYEA